jgi:hypothetical protein
MCSKSNGILQESNTNTLQETKGYTFTIIITGYSKDIESVMNLKENLASEIWNDPCIISDPIFLEIPKL